MSINGVPSHWNIVPVPSEGQLFAEDWKHLFRGVEPFLRKWTDVPDNYEDIYQQMLREMQQPDFVAISRLLTVWGTRPST